MVVQTTRAYQRKGKLILGEGSGCIFVLLFVIFMLRGRGECLKVFFFQRTQRRNNDGEDELLSFTERTYKKLLLKTMNIQQGEKQYNPFIHKENCGNDNSPTISVTEKKRVGMGH